MGKYWLGMTKPKKAFKLTWNVFNNCYRIFLKKLEFSSDCLPSDQHNSTMAKATHLIFSLFDVTPAWVVPFGILQYVQYILHGLTIALLFVPFIFTDSKKCRFMWWLPLRNRIFFSIFSYWLLWLQSCFSSTSRSVLGGNGLNAAGNEA